MTAFAQAAIPLSQADIDALARGSDELQPCVGEYMRSHPLDESTGKAMIDLGLASELKDRALAVVGPQSNYRLQLTELNVSRPEDVANILFILAQETAETKLAVDGRPSQLSLAVFNYYTAKLAGEGCKIEPGFATRVQDASVDRLAPLPGLGFDGPKMQREIDQAVLCAFGHFAPHAKGSDQINAYIASHGDLEALRKDVEEFIAEFGGEASRALLAPLAAEASPGIRLAGYMNLLVGAERSRSLAMTKRYRASALSAYHLVRATDNSCKLGKSPLELIGKE